MGLLKSTEFIYQYEINNITEDHAQKAFGKKDYSPTLTQNDGLLGSQAPFLSSTD